jgi:predicted transcriptional regulator
MGRSPKGVLTRVEFEIMEAIWHSPKGATVSEVWAVIGRVRGVTRTTVLNQVAKLGERGWLKRRKCDGVYRYVATVDRDTASANVAAKLVDEFFGGSASELVMSLFDAKQISKEEWDELCRIVDRGGSCSDTRQE